MDNGDAPATKKNLLELEARLEARIDQRFGDFETRMEKKLEEFETRILRGIETFLRQGTERVLRLENRTNSLQTSDESINRRITDLDTRVLELEKRLGMIPPQFPS